MSSPLFLLQGVCRMLARPIAPILIIQKLPDLSYPFSPFMSVDWLPKTTAHKKDKTIHSSGKLPTHYHSSVGISISIRGIEHAVLELGWVFFNSRRTEVHLLLICYGCNTLFVSGRVFRKKRRKSIYDNSEACWSILYLNYSWFLSTHIQLPNKLCIKSIQTLKHH